jgi:hypothetical protein
MFSRPLTAILRFHVSTEMHLSFISKQNDSGVCFFILLPVKVPVHDIPPCFAMCIEFCRTALDAIQQLMMATLPFAKQVEPTVFFDTSPTLHRLCLVFLLTCILRVINGIEWKSVTRNLFIMCKLLSCLEHADRETFVRSYDSSFRNCI